MDDVDRDDVDAVFNKPLFEDKTLFKDKISFKDKIPFDVEAVNAGDWRVLRNRCDGFFEECRRQAEKVERVQENKRRALDHWIKSRGVDKNGLWVGRPAVPRPMRDGRHTPVARMIRHLDNPAGRLFLTARAAQTLILPRLTAKSLNQRDDVNVLVAAMLRLDEATETGLLDGFVVFWQQTGCWPHRPRSVRLHWPDGKAQGDRLRGEYGATLSELMRLLQDDANRIR